MNKKLSAILKDNTSGSTDLLIKLAKLFNNYIESPASLEKFISEAGENLESFGVITSYLNEISNAIKEKDFEQLKKIVIKPLSNRNENSLMLQNAMPFLDKVDTVFTFSNSRTILEILKAFASERKKVQVFITESRPQKEGKILVRKLLKENIVVQFGADVLMPYFIKQSDAVFLGADKLLPDGSIVNKTGSVNAAIIAAYYQKPVYVFAVSSKKSAFFTNTEKDSAEIWNNNNINLTIKNTHFEVVSADLITRTFTEST